MWDPGGGKGAGKSAVLDVKMNGHKTSNQPYYYTFSKPASDGPRGLGVKGGSLAPPTRNYTAAPGSELTNRPLVEIMA